MEYVLLLLLIVLVIYAKNANDTRADKIDNKLRDMHRDIDDLKKMRGTFEKPIEKIPETKADPIIAKPIERQIQIPEPEPPKPIVETAQVPEPIIVPEPIKAPEPVVVVPVPEPVVKSIVGPVVETPKEKPILSAADSISTPQPAPLPKFVAEKSWSEKFKEDNPDLEKFIGENLINKIGVLILVLGISYFVKYAIDKNWINEPARVGIGILAGALVMGFAHRLRKNYAAFSSVLVAGAIAIFYFTIGIAFHDYHLFNQTVAFVIMVVITAFSAVISLSYDRRELAVLSLIGGFAVPFMVSTGKGDYTVLFTYIAILDVGILALAYHKKWSIINILSYIFTVVLFGTWLVQDLQTETPHYVGALLFGFVFYFIFILINIINNLRTKGTFTGFELGILVSNTFLFYSAGMVILSASHPEFKGLFTLALAVLNLVYSWFLYKRFGLDKTAVYLLIGMTLTFTTLVIPIQFEGNYITLFWAGEAVILMWLAQQSKIIGYRFASIVVHLLMFISLLMDWNNIYNSGRVLTVIANPVCLTGLVAVLSLGAIIWLLRNDQESYSRYNLTFNAPEYFKVLKPIAIVLFYFVGLFETVHQSYRQVYGDASAFVFPVIWHLVFCAVLFHLLVKSRTLVNLRLASIIACINMVLYAILFSNSAFYEHRDYIEFGVAQRIAFYLHYVSLAITVYFAVGMYRMNRERSVFAFYKEVFFFWVCAFLVVFITSKELVLHGIVASNSPVTMAELQAHKSYDYYKVNDLDSLREMVADDHIGRAKDLLYRTALPVLWGLIAFIFLILGIRRKTKILRIMALSLLGVTILKLFLFDIRNASETGKIIAFILLGVLILIISFVYQKLKVLVLDDKTASDAIPHEDPKPNPDDEKI